MTPKGQVTVVVRPEHANLLKSAAKGDLKGKLETAVYFGTDTHYHVALDGGGGSFIVRTQNSRRAGEGFEVGDTVGIALERPCRSGVEGLSMATAREASEASAKRDVRTRWLLTSPALVIIFFAAIGPLFVMLLYSFMVKGDYGDVKYWQFSGAGWFEVFFERDIFDETVSLAEGHLSVLWRSIRLSIYTTLLSLILGYPTAYFIATRPERSRDAWLFLVTIPFWTNLLIRTFAIQELIRGEGLINLVLLKVGVIDEPIQMLFTDFAIMLGMAYVYLPLMVLPLYANMEKMDFRLVEAGYDLYATRFRVLPASSFRCRSRASSPAPSWCSFRHLAPMSRRACWAVASC